MCFYILYTLVNREIEKKIFFKKNPEKPQYFSKRSYCLIF